MFEDLISACQELLDSSIGESAKCYLNSRISQDAQQEFQFGYFPPDQYINSLISLIPESFLLESNLAFYKEENYGVSSKDVLKSFFNHHNLILPYRDVYGETIGIVGRSLLSEENRQALGISKYKNTHLEKTKHLFMLDKTKNSILECGEAILVEGQFDAIQAFDNGIKNVIAVGSSNLHFLQCQLLARYAETFVLAFDNDEAGIAGEARAIEKYGKYFKFRKLKLPQGYKDLDEFLKDGEKSLNHLIF